MKGNCIDKDSVGFHLNQALTLQSSVFIPKVIQIIISNHENWLGIKQIGFKLFPSPGVIYISLWKWALTMTLISIKLQIINMKIGGGYTRKLLQVTTLQGRNELQDFQIGMTWKSVLGLRRVKLDCEKSMFLLLANFRQISTWKIWFHPIQAIFPGKITQIRQILMIL